MKKTLLLSVAILTFMESAMALGVSKKQDAENSQMVLTLIQKGNDAFYTQNTEEAQKAYEQIRDYDSDCAKAYIDALNDIEDNHMQKDTTTLKVEKEAEFEGGEDKMMQFLCKTIHYPEYSSSNGETGKCFFELVIEADGSISKITVIKAQSPLLAEEGIRTIKLMPKWKPAEYNGNKVRSHYTLPLSFMIR